MGKTITLNRSAVAEAWGTSPQYVSKVKRQVREEGGEFPAFRSVKAARDWYAARKQRGPVEYSTRPESQAVELPPVDLAKLFGSTDEEEDFDALMVKHAEMVPRAAYELYMQAVSAGNDILVSTRIKNWGEASKQAAGIREKFVALQEKTGHLLPMDIVLDVIGSQLQSLVNALDGMGKRWANRANPESPELAKEIFDEAADEVKRRTLESRERIEAEILSRREEIAEKLGGNDD